MNDKRADKVIVAVVTVVFGLPVAAALCWVAYLVGSVLVGGAGT